MKTLPSLSLVCLLPNLMDGGGGEVDGMKMVMVTEKRNGFRWYIRRRMKLGCGGKVDT